MNVTLCENVRMCHKKVYKDVIMEVNYLEILVWVSLVGRENGLRGLRPLLFLWEVSLLSPS